MITFLHGLESTVDADLLPIGRKVQWLRPRYPGLSAPGLDTRAAIALKAHCTATGAGWFDDEARLAAAFERPMANARAGITSQTRLVIGSSFGGAVLLRLLHEGGWSGPSIFQYVMPAHLHQPAYRAAATGDVTRLHSPSPRHPSARIAFWKAARFSAGSLPLNRGESSTLWMPVAYPSSSMK